MTPIVRAWLETQVDLLFQGRFADMLPRFDLPLAVQVGADMTVLSTQVQFIDVMADYRAGLIASGVIGLGVRITAVDLPRRGRFRIWADFDHHRAAGIDQSADQMILYCRQDRDDIQVELLHCTRLARLTGAIPSRVRLA